MPVLSRPHVPTLYSGDVLVRIAGVAPPDAESELVELPFPAWLVEAVDEILAELDPAGPRAPVDRLVHSLPPFEILRLEQAAATGSHPPLHSLTSYFRVWLRDRPPLGRVLAERLSALPGVDRAWLETTASSAALRGFPPPTVQGRPAPLGVGVNAVRSRAGGKGQGASVYVLESGWRRTHPDLRAAKIAPPLWGADAGGTTPGTIETIEAANHGTSTLGVLVARRSAGLAPGARVHLVSCRDAAGAVEHVADAIVAVLGQARPGAVLLLEVQRGTGVPTETEDPDLDAIRLATSRGVVVVEPAGNSGADLDLWTSPRPLDPAAAGFVDSGAILVGALAGMPPASGAGWSCHGARIDTWAHGEGVSTSGAPYGTIVRSVVELDGHRRDDYSGTSAAAAVVGGVVAVLAGLDAHGSGGVLHPLDTRARLRPRPFATRVGRPALPNLALLAAQAVQRSRPAPRVLPPVPISAAPRPHPGRRPARVSHPQTSEGNTNIRSTGSTNDTEVAWVHLPHPAGSVVFSLPGGTPTAGATQWTEAWKHYNLAASLGLGATPPFASFWFHFGSSGPPSPPAGAGTPVASSSLTFRYAAVPATAPAAPSAPFVQGHFDVYLWTSTTATLAGAMRRFIDPAAKQVREFWMLNASYRFPSADLRVEMRFVPNAQPASFATWFAGWQGSGTAPPWYVEIAYGW